MRVASAASTTRRWPALLAPAVATLGIILTIAVVPGLFTVDENNYLVNVVALRQGHLSLPATSGLPPSAELAFFDPAADERTVTSTPVASTAPPLYGPVALPFAWLGWRGLVALNTLAYLVTICMVFAHARRDATSKGTPWLAAGAFALCGFTIEYALGVWPHALSVALCTGGVLLVARCMEDGDLRRAAAAGLLLALVTGVRYQNAVFLGMCGVAILLWSDRRWRTAVCYTAGAILPLAASSLMNRARIGSWNPISKGAGYFDVPVASGGGGSAILDVPVMFWARLVDFGVRPPLTGASFGWVTYDPASGAHLIFGTTVQKALLQSAPWAILALVLFAVAWFRPVSVPPPRLRQLRLFGLLSVTLLTVFALSGPARHEGASFNQRYLLELVPLMAIAVAWAVDGLKFRAAAFWTGGLLGALLAGVLLGALPSGPLQHWMLLKVPLVLAAAVVVLWWLAPRGERWGAQVAAVGLALGWAFALHLFDDVSASREVRQGNALETDSIRRGVPDGAALLTYWGFKDAAGPLLLERDLVILDLHADEGETAPVLVRELMSRGRRVFVLESGMPPDVMTHATGGLERVQTSTHGDIVELRAKRE
jgi:hypothetical protein